MPRYRTPEVEALALELHRRIERIARYQAAVKLLRMVLAATDTALGYKDNPWR